MNARSVPHFVLATAVACALGPAQVPSGFDTASSNLRSPDLGPGARGSTPVFIPDRGQWGDGSIFRARCGPVTARFVLDGWTLACFVAGEEAPAGPASFDGTGRRVLPASIRGVAIRMGFEGAADIAPVGEDPIPGRFHYLLGADSAQWVTDVPGFGRIRYPAMYPGIDVVVRDGDGVLEYDLRLEPGADLASVVIRCEGVERLSIERDGSLLLRTALGVVRQKAPPTWHELVSGERRPVTCRYRLLEGQRYGFEVPDGSAQHRLVIDPDLTWLTSLGGADTDRAYAIAADDQRIVTVAGMTASPDFPTTTGGFQTSLAGSRDCFVSRLDPRQTGRNQLLWSTYLGGNQDDLIFDVAVDPSGMATVAGLTLSAGFPATGGSTFGGGIDGFVARLDPTASGGQQLSWSTLLGGPGNDWVCALSVDENTLETTVGGYTGSPTFPVTPNAYQGVYAGGNADAFVSRLGHTGSLTYSTFLGGTSDEPWTTSLPSYPFELRMLDLVADRAGHVVVAGMTHSGNFPTTPGAYQPNHRGIADAFITRLDLTASGSQQLSWSTFLGGSSTDTPMSVGLQVANGRVALGGYTYSSDFPTTPGAYQPTFTGPSGFNDAFVSWLDPAQTGLNQLVYSTYLGSTGHDVVLTTHVDQRGFATIGGFSTGPGFPTTAGCYQPNHQWKDDGILARIDPAGNGAGSLIYATYFGGPPTVSSYEFVTDLAFDGPGGVWFAGDSEPSGGLGDATVGHLNLLPSNVDRVREGSGPHCDGAILFEVSELPTAGQSFRFLVGNAPRQSTMGVLVFGFAQPVWPFGGMNLVTLPIATATLSSDLHGTAAFPIPYGGQSGFRVQVVWLNNVTCAGSQPLSSSAALEF